VHVEPAVESIAQLLFSFVPRLADCVKAIELRNGGEESTVFHFL
jgi:hypothetical protein